MRTPLALLAVAVAMVLAGAGVWQAVQPAATTVEQDVTAIAATLRCPTCQGLSVADSDAAISRSMRDIIAEQLAEGRSPDEVRGYFVQRYGDWILLSPSPDGLGWLVWGLPVLALLGGAGVAVSRTRQPAAVSAADLEHAAELARLHADGRLALSQTPAGERLEAALDVAAQISDEQVTVAGRRAVMARIGAAVAAQRREAAAVVPSAPDRPAPSPTTPCPNRTSTRRHRLGWAGVTGTFVVVLVATLGTNLASRGAGDLPTGNLAAAEGTADPSPTAELEALLATVEQNPQDVPSRLELAGRLLQLGDVDGARANAQTVLEQRPDQPDGLLLLGLALATDGSAVAPQTLQRFLDNAPADHPGIPLARSLLDPPQ